MAADRTRRARRPDGLGLAYGLGAAHCDHGAAAGVDVVAAGWAGAERRPVAERTAPGRSAAARARRNSTSRRRATARASARERRGRGAGTRRRGASGAGDRRVGDGRRRVVAWRRWRHSRRAARRMYGRGGADGMGVSPTSSALVGGAPGDDPRPRGTPGRTSHTAGTGSTRALARGRGPRSRRLSGAIAIARRMAAGAARRPAARVDRRGCRGTRSGTSVGSPRGGTGDQFGRGPARCAGAAAGCRGAVADLGCGCGVERGAAAVRGSSATAATGDGGRASPARTCTARAATRSP